MMRDRLPKRVNEVLRAGGAELLKEVKGLCGDGGAALLRCRRTAIIRLQAIFLLPFARSSRAFGRALGPLAY